MAVCVWTVNLYGILVTEESYLKGARTYVRAQFQRSIIKKVVPGNVPTELVDQILQDSDDQARRIVDDMWAACTTADQVDRKFSFWPGSAGAELLDIVSNPVTLTPFRRINITKSTLGIDAFPITKHTAANTANFVHGEDRETKYVVLSTSARHPLPYELVERPLAPSVHYPNSRIYAGDRGITIAWQGQNGTAPHVAADSLSFYHDDDVDTSIDSGAGSVQADRVLQLRGVKEAIRDWDAEKMKDFVEKLQLVVLPMDPANPMEPEIIQAQRVHAR
ncbi:hypothetical protein CB0940_04946 [Cercospora beticola]|uniref:Uncharacterized protein n=1 Tax=Cercospora beticola TaxID=122368 RepID=A0A2G5HMA5_CERBT|nr:hypothetical protein CB0940_04946 [Cercospora beticola]PIA93342.1 hypothetical protein CB0940_04946 [Cercospora beticola]WPB02233.1 hypothetical protein RHO25_006867 [Cercospora beticola]CAK1362902.1 unnamed protein product [Cercospora beticola]